MSEKDEKKSDECSTGDDPPFDLSEIKTFGFHRRKIEMIFQSRSLGLLSLSLIEGDDKVVKSSQQNDEEIGFFLFFISR